VRTETFPATVTVADVIAELVAQTLPACAPALAQRLERAAIIATTPYAIHAGSTGVAVHCLQDWATVYLVSDDGRCTCPDFVNRGGPCKHALAVDLLSRATAERHRRQRARDFGARWELTEAGAAALSALA
jgi:hypothetical protein